MIDKNEWVLVPREPTEAMLSHGEAWGYSTISDGTEMARQVYAGMLAAAPKPESAEAVYQLRRPTHPDMDWFEVNKRAFYAFRDKDGHEARILYTAPPRPEASDPHVATIQRPGWPRRDSAVYFTMEHAAYDFPPGTLLYATPQQASAPVGVEWVVPEGQFPANVEVDGSGRAVLVSYGKGYPSGRYIRAQQPPVAPVGVEASQLADELEAWAKEPFVALTPMRRMDIEGFANRIRALAQQPAAVDDATVARFLEAFRNTSGDEAIDADEKVARRWLTAALAGQQQGGTQE